MRWSWYGAPLLGAVVSLSNLARAQSEDGSDWFEPEEPEAQPAEAPEPPPAEPRVQPPATRPRDEPAATHDRRGQRHHHGKKAASARSLSLIGGKTRIDAPELVDALERAGYPDPTDLRFVGLQGTRVTRGRLVLGLGGTLGWSERLERSDGSAGRMILMQLRGNVGYALVNSDKWLLYPALEVALNRLELDLGAPGVASFDEALAEPRTGTELVRNSFAAGGSVAVERRFGLRRHSRADAGRFFAVGLRGGWMRDMVESPWRVDGDGDARGPEERHTVKYIGLTLGFGQARF